MTRSFLFVALASALVAGTAFAAPGAAEGRQGAMTRLDANGDGAIDKAEAAQAPRLAERFDRMDRNGDGRLTADERPQRRGHRGGPGGGLDRIVKLDANQDGRISKVEVADMPRLAERFDAIDRNRDGYIVRSELRAHHEAMRAEHEAKREERRQARFAEADGNNDGRLSKAEVDASMPRLAPAFAFMDENRDGYLSASEAEPIGGQRGHGGHADRGGPGRR
ncbi:EF-hand domain-containing protein [Lysobacter sp. SG-8]|uniref:EF-hand domain-containing protein n=1 Tax=Marilutibacter penaei TaxID=2759900 RepID=A0A7W3U1U5_9GAMM|nr:EF-hand domain-containing protein [Lysobacter penaei]MBB1087352.1 EF-hand domain-containing protein [Lysobacter penaei]